MILNDKQIKKLAEAGMIEPFIGQQVSAGGKVSYGLSSFGYDMRCGHQFKIFHNTYSSIVDPKALPDKAFVEINNVEECIIPPNGFALTHTVERFKMPEDVMGLCIGKSTYARCGIVVNVTPIEPGWEGHITVEISNTTPNPCRVYPLEGIAQLMFFKGERPEITYADKKGKYQDQPAQVVLPRVIGKE